MAFRIRRALFYEQRLKFIFKISYRLYFIIEKNVWFGDLKSKIIAQFVMLKGFCFAVLVA